MADEIAGTQVSAIDAWQKRSLAAGIGFSLATGGVSQVWYALNEKVR